MARWKSGDIRKGIRKRLVGTFEVVDDKVFLRCCEQGGLPMPKVEYIFHPDRSWKFDYYFEHGDKRCALEVEGGIFRKGGGAHSSVGGILRDMEKYNAAAVMGIYVYRVLPRDKYNKKVFSDIAKILGL